MRKLIGGKYVTVDAPAAKAGESKPKAAPAKQTFSMAAKTIVMLHPRVDFSSLIGSGHNGQITKPDVENFVKGLKA